eukprot:COSAG01_NODE_398_length_17547_cov_206.793501_8_plen_492_part_00
MLNKPNKLSILVLDLGTSSIRSFLFSEQLSIIASAQKSINIAYPNLGWVEQDPEQIWQVTLSCIQEILKCSNKINDLEISAVAITNQRETSIVWDSTTDEALYPAIVWQDRRTVDHCKALDQHARLIKSKTGLRLDPYFSATKLAWLLENINTVKLCADQGHLRFGTVDTWIIWKLTQGKSHVTDVSNASRTLLYNIHDLNYDPDLLRLFKIPKTCLPKVSPSLSNFGYTDAAITKSPLPILAVLGDQQAALFAQCGSDRKAVKNTYGTGLFLMANTGSQIPKTNTLINTIAWQYDAVLEYALEGSIFSGGSAIQWLRDNLELIKSSEESDLLSSKIQDTDGLFFIPALTGLGAPYWQADAVASFVGMRASHGKAHLCRAVLESLAYQSKTVIDDMQTVLEQNFDILKVDGGATQNNFLMQFQADILNIPVQLAANKESTAQGVAGLAGLGLGFWDLKTYTALRLKGKLYQSQKSNKNNYQAWHNHLLSNI